jgi:tRNA splicing ligase
MPSDTTIPPYLIAVLIAAVTALAGTVAYLFKHFSTKEAESAKERMAWALERQKFDTQRDEYEIALRLEYEARHRVVLENHIKMMATSHEASRDHEDLVRREFAQLMETVSSKATEGSDKVAAVMDKFYDRFVGTRRPPKG